MGTSHRHTPGVKGEPNWGSASSAMTQIANAELKSEQLTNTPPPNASKKYIEQQQKKYTQSINSGYHRAVRNLVRAAGGRTRVASGNSRALGHSGVVVAQNLVNTVAEIANKGLSNWLKAKGKSEDLGKSRVSILNYLREYLQSNVVGMDDTAANEALEYVLDKFEDKIDSDASNFEDVMTSTISSSDILEIVDEFMGVYIFSHLSQNFKEKLEHEKGTSVTSTTFNEIKDLIMDDVRRGFNGHSSLNIDWTGSEGRLFIQQEFNRIIYILSGNED